MPSTLHFPNLGIDIEVGLPTEEWPPIVQKISKEGAKKMADELDRVGRERGLADDERYLRELIKEHHDI